MKIIVWFFSICLLRCAIGQQAPWARPDIPVTAKDRVYTADQTSNTVSVIDPAENK
jgi:DNA-binding beta-propeller fold protein YncE